MVLMWKFWYEAPVVQLAVDAWCCVECGVGLTSAPSGTKPRKATKHQLTGNMPRVNNAAKRAFAPPSLLLPGTAQLTYAPIQLDLIEQEPAYVIAYRSQHHQVGGHGRVCSIDTAAADTQLLGLNILILSSIRTMALLRRLHRV